jgi:hypothetical protein
VTSADSIAQLFAFDISDRAPDDWPGLLSRDPSAEYSQTRYWIDAVCTHLPDARPVWLTMRRDGVLVGGMCAVERLSGSKAAGLIPRRKRMESSLEGTTGGPLVAYDLEQAEEEHVFNRLVDGYGSATVGWLGTRALVLGPTQEKRFGSLMQSRPEWVRTDAPTAAVSLQGGPDTVQSTRLVRTKRNERNRALRRGVELINSQDLELLREYYGIYLQATRHWGIEASPLALLEYLLQDPGGRVFFICARFEGQVIGGHLNLNFGPRVMAWNGVTDPAFSRSHFPSTLCFWGDMVEACRRGAAWLDMGGSGGVDSLVGFKKYFGAELQMRGLYVRDSLAAGIIRKGRDRWRARPGIAPAPRWHDEVSGSGSGESS